MESIYFILNEEKQVLMLYVKAIQKMFATKELQIIVYVKSIIPCSNDVIIQELLAQLAVRKQLRCHRVKIVLQPTLQATQNFG